MKTFNHLIVLAAILAFTIILAEFVIQDNNLVYQIIILFSVCLFGFNLLARKIAWFKPYFTSKYNLLTGKFRSNMEFDFSKKLLFHKFAEVLKSSGFRIIQANEDKGELFAISSLSWYSWGENIYITIEESERNTFVRFCSASFFGIYSWDKNRQNIIKLLNKFEESLVI